jgi:hypothetical protein
VSWFDFFDDIFRGSSNSGAGGGGTFSQYALSEFAAQVPYIGQYLGFYLTGREDLSELTNFPDGPADADADTSGAKRYDFEDFGIDGASEQKLLRNPNLLAENTAPKAKVESWQDVLPAPPGMGQEIVLDIGGPPRAQPAPPQPEPMQVFIRGVRPDRSTPPPLPNPPRYVPYRVAAESRPELQAPPRAETAAPAVQWTEEVIITAEPLPFNREVSDPEALARAEGMGRIEWGDLVQLVRGGYNGLISAWQQFARIAVREGLHSMVGPIVEPMLSSYAEDPIREVDKYRLSIDPHYGGAGMVGEQLTENLAFEALPFAPQLGKLLVRRAARSGHLLAPTFWFMGAEGISGGSRAGRTIHLAAAHAADANRLEAALAEVTAQKQVAEDIIMIETGLWKPKSGWSQAEVLGHLRRLRERSSIAAQAYRDYTAAIETLSDIPRQRGREIFWDPPWIRPK